MDEARSSQAHTAPDRTRNSTDTPHGPDVGGEGDTQVRPRATRTLAQARAPGPLRPAPRWCHARPQCLFTRLYQ